MKETEVRDRIHSAFGDSSYPPQLTSRIAAHLGDPPRSQGHPFLLGAVAFILALAIVGTLVFARLQTSPPPVPAVTPPAGSTPQSTPQSGLAHIPQADLDRAQLSSAQDQVTQLNLTSTSGGRTVTLIGAYADNARTVLFFRTMPAAGFPNVSVYDDSGFLNASSTGGRASIGDTFYALDTGPHAGSDGMAHLRVVISSFEPESPNGAQEQGNWTFSFALKPAPSTGLTLTPPLTSVGTWKLTIEAMEVNPTLIHFQAVIDGAAVEDIKHDTITLLDAEGQAVQDVSYSAGTTVPKSQITSVPPRNTRVNVDWARPAGAARYFLVIAGGGAQYRGTLDIPAPTPISGKKGIPYPPTGYPAATEAITFDGALSTSVLNAHPSACGSGTGPSGTVFAFAMWFQVDQAWYMVAFTTDPTVRQYNGPGTYNIKASLYPEGGDAIFTGPVQLTVISDRRPGPQTGTVRGTLTWTGPSAQPVTVNVSGNWTCTWSQQLGPG